MQWIFSSVFSLSLVSDFFGFECVCCVFLCHLKASPLAELYRLAAVLTSVISCALDWKTGREIWCSHTHTHTQSRSDPCNSCASPGINTSPACHLPLGKHTHPVKIIKVLQKRFLKFSTSCSHHQMFWWFNTEIISSFWHSNLWWDSPLVFLHPQTEHKHQPIQIDITTNDLRQKNHHMIKWTPVLYIDLQYHANQNCTTTL